MILKRKTKFLNQLSDKTHIFKCIFKKKIHLIKSAKHFCNDEKIMKKRYTVIIKIQISMFFDLSIQISSNINLIIPIFKYTKLYTVSNFAKEILYCFD